MSVRVSDGDVAVFHAVRPRLFGIAYQVLGSPTEADDVVQDAWLRWQRTDRTEVRDAAAFLATTTMRLAINVIQSAHARRETVIAAPLDASGDPQPDPAQEIEQREALELALQVLLARLSPAERAAYVLREAFDYPYRQVAQVLSVSEANARQLVLRARRRLTTGIGRPVAVADQQRLLDAFVAAAQTGRLASLERLLVADVTPGVRATRHAVIGAPRVPLAA